MKLDIEYSLNIYLFCLFSSFQNKVFLPGLQHLKKNNGSA